MRNGDKMLDPGTIIGLLIAVAVIGVFFYVLFLCMKKDNKELDKILSGLTKVMLIMMVIIILQLRQVIFMT